LEYLDTHQDILSPSTGEIYNSLDTYFDGEFNSTLALEPSRFLGHLDETMTDSMPDTDLPIHHTGNPFIYTRNYPARHTQFVQAKVEGIFDEDLTRVDDDVPKLEEKIEHHVKNQTIELRVKFVDDEQTYWTRLMDLNNNHPKAVIRYMEDNNLIDNDPHISDDYITEDGGATTTEVKE
jgi:hypothetical protein